MGKRSAIRLTGLAAVLTALLGADTWSQSGPVHISSRTSEFQFVRLAYNSDTGGFGRLERWLTDWPEAEGFLIGGLKRLTRIDVADEGTYFSIMDDRLYDHPWLYAVEVGYWYLNDAEAARLRDYLLRGGFLMVDDFHGGAQWAGFVDSMRRVFPDRPIVDIPLDDPIFHVVYDLNEPIQIPGIRMMYTGNTWEEADDKEPHWRGIYDDRGRLMVVINHNMDLGDAWEHADIPEYALQYTLRAYEYTIDYIVYAMTH
jgi:hypothetical protein